MTPENQVDAVDLATEFLRLYAPNKPPKQAFGVAQLADSKARIGEALREAQVVLNRTSTQAFDERVRSLTVSKRKQFVVNVAHLLTGSGFVLLIADVYPELVRWVGAVLSFAAGIVALLLPKNLAATERETVEDISQVSYLSGEIAQIQAEFEYLPDKDVEKNLHRVASLIGECMRLSKKYELDKIALEVGYLPRPPAHKTQKKIHAIP